LPDGDGLDFLRQQRARGLAVPVLILTARDAVEDRVEGLQGGADDYLLKPFDLDELQARVQALLRRAAGYSGQCIRHGPIVMDPATRTVTCRGDEIELTRSEFAILERLLLGWRGIVSNEQLADSL